MKTILIAKKAGTFAENKDIARDLRLNQIVPVLKVTGREVVLDFRDVTGATQSFIHALLSDVLREYGDEVFERLFFKNCTQAVQQVINIVADYMEES